MGGSQAFSNKLDTLFEQGHYWHVNEPNHQIPYLYAFTGQPWKTQKLVRKIIREEYDTGMGGLSGNEDGGQMSAWLVFSMMGFYPVTPGSPVYILGSPVFEETVLNLKGKKFSIVAKGVSDSALYIQSATLNGQPFTRTYLLHEELAKGGKLILQMADKPNKNWGTNANDLPSSLSE